MEYQRLEWKEDELLADMLKKYDDGRGVEPTLTSYIYCLTKARWTELLGQSVPGRTLSLYFLLGLGLERTLLAKNEVAVGMKDGIPYHMDDLDLDGLIELKSTRMKPSDEPSLTDGWLKQIKGYLYGEGLTEINFVSIHLVQPDIRVFRLTFTEEELQDNWNWILERKADYDRMKEEGEFPTPYEWRLGEFECNNCQFAMACEVQSLKEKYG